MDSQSKEENARLKSELTDLRARLGIPSTQDVLAPVVPRSPVNEPNPFWLPQVILRQFNHLFQSDLHRHKLMLSKVVTVYMQ